MSSLRLQTAILPVLAGAVVMGLGCSEPKATEERGPAGWTATEPPADALPVPFVVDDHFHPSNCYDDPEDCTTVVFDAKGCSALARPQGAQGQCYGFRYLPSGPAGFGGVFFVEHPKGGANWGELEGRAIEPDARRVSFFAAAPDGSAPTVHFKVGGIDDAKLAYRDTLDLDVPIVLGRDFQKYEISLEAQSYDKVIGAFGWTMLGEDGLGPFQFFVDDVRWE